MKGRSSGLSSSDRVAVASRLWPPSSLMISLTRGNHFGSVGRRAAKGRSSQTQ